MPRLPRSSPALLLAILASVGCSDAPKKASADDTVSIQHQGNRVVVPPSSPLAKRLEVEPVQLTSITRQVTAPASVEADPARYARILPPLNGRVLKLFVHPGDAVMKGDELLLLDSADFGTAQAEYARARTVLTQTEHSLERQQDLAAHGIVGQREVEQAKTDRDSAQSDFNRTKDRLRLLGMDPDTTTLGSPLIVRSPLTGKVLDILTATGEFRNDPTAPLMTVADLSDIWVTANVQEKDIHFVHRGDPAAAIFAAYPTETFAGKGVIRCGRARSRYPHSESANRLSQSGWPSSSCHVCHGHAENVGHKGNDGSHDCARTLRRQDHRVCSGFAEHV